MSARAREVIEDDRELAEDEIAGAVAELQDQAEQTGLPDDVDAAWQDEIVARLRSIKDGSAVLYDGDHVDAELSRLLGEEA